MGCISSRYEITAEDIFRAIEFDNRTSGTLADNIVLNLGFTKFKLYEKSGFEVYRFANGKMGFYQELDDGWVKIYEVKGNSFWVKTLSKGNFLTLYGPYISKVIPENPDKIEPDETDTLTKAIINEAERLGKNSE